MNLFETLPLAATFSIARKTNKTSRWRPGGQEETASFSPRRIYARKAILSLVSAFLFLSPCTPALAQEGGEGDRPPADESAPDVVGSSNNVASTAARTITAASSKGVALTIYNQGFGVVKDTRSISLDGGVNYIRFEDVAAAIDPTTVSFVSNTAPNSVVVREQNYQYDVMSPQSILAKSVGKNIAFKQYLENGSVREVRGILLNPPVVTVVDINGNPEVRQQGLVVKTDEGIVLSPAGQAQLIDLPPGLVSKPSLLWKLETSKPGSHETEISYQTKGMNWHCDYVAIVNKDDTTADLTSWVTLDNQSGAGYKKASLKLLAGDVHQVPVANQMATMEMAADASIAPASPQFSEKSFAEYHLYTLAGTTDISDNETKQMSLFNAAQVPTRKLFIFEPTRPVLYATFGSANEQQKIHVKMELENTKKNNLGMAMPKGKVRVYKADEDGSLQFIGEDQLDHTPRDEKIRLFIGDAFDLVGERKDLNYERPNDHLERRTVEISLRNRKDTKVTITAVEHAWGDWKIQSNSHKYVKKDSTTFEFPVEVPPGQEVKVTYEIETRT